MLGTEAGIELKPFYIGGILVDPPLALAPMAGYTNYAFRVLCRESGDCGLVFTGLLSSYSMQQKTTLQRTRQMFDWREDEKPFAVQLFGRDPALMAQAARIVVDHSAHIVDINMGCSMPKVAQGGSGSGAALLQDVDTAITVVQAVVAAVEVPVTIKIRAGWDVDNPTAVPLAIAAERAGVQAITVHARFARQRFDGKADWSFIRQVKEAVHHIPVIGNGDVGNTADVIRMMQSTGCDGVMIGRAALGNPWVFQQIAREIRTGTSLSPPTMAERAKMVLRQARLTLETTRYPAEIAFLELRGQVLKYVTDFPNAKKIRAEIVRAQTLEDIETVFQPFLRK